MINYHMFIYMFLFTVLLRNFIIICYSLFLKFWWVLSWFSVLYKFLCKLFYVPCVCVFFHLSWWLSFISSGFLGMVLTRNFQNYNNSIVKIRLDTLEWVLGFSMCDYLTDGTSTTGPGRSTCLRLRDDTDIVAPLHFHR